jgi:MoaA/NifB/PqqE/SkfB family radical SAM enzyme
MKNLIIAGKTTKGIKLPHPLAMLCAILLSGLLRTTLVVCSQGMRSKILTDSLENQFQNNTIYISRPNQHTPAAVTALTIRANSRLVKFSLRYFVLHAISSARKIFRKVSLARYVFSRLKNIFPKTSLSTVAGATIGAGEQVKFLNTDWANFSVHEIRELPKELTLVSLTELIGENYPGPQGIHIALLNRCNLECVMCPYHSPKYRSEQTSGYFDKTRQMSDEIFLSILDSAVSMGSSLQFGQIEEALIHPKAIEWMALSKKSGIHVHLTTNGTLLSGRKMEQLAKAEIDSLMFSLDASSPEVYRRIRGEDLSKIESNINGFLEFIAEHGLRKPKIWVSFIMQEQSESEKSEFLSKWKDLGADNVTYYELSDIDPKTGRVIRKEFTYDRRERYTCSSPWEQCVIYPEGEVSLCCQSMLETGWRGVVSMGSLKENSLEAIWAGKVYNDLRTRLIKNQLNENEVCFGCDLWSSGSYFVEESELFRRIYNETSDTYQIKKRVSK